MPNEPALIDVLNLFKKQIFLDLNSHHLATIQSFDPDNQTVTATINYKKTDFQFDPVTGLYNQVLVPYPLLADVPVIVLGGASAKLTFPIAQGDECILLFNDRDIDNWFQSGQVSGNATGRLHSFADGVALVGLNSLNNLIQDYDPDRTVLRNGNAGVGVGLEKIKIFNEITTLNTLLQNILTKLENLATAAAAITVTGVTSGGALSGPPSNASTFTGLASDLTSLATQLGGLLE